MEELIKQIVDKVNAELETEITKIVGEQINIAIDQAIGRLQSMKVLLVTNPSEQQASPIKLPSGTPSRQPEARKESNKKAYQDRREQEKTIKCLECETEFTVRATSQRRYCEKHLTHYKPAPQESVAKYAWEDKQCSECGKTYTPMRYDQKYCSKLCNHANYRKSRGIVPLSESPINCGNCGIKFVRDRQAQKYCTVECTKLAKKAYQKTYLKEYREKPVQKHDCAFCGKETVKLFCSDDCRKAHEAAIAPNPSISEEDRLEAERLAFAQRDGTPLPPLQRKKPPGRPRGKNYVSSKEIRQASENLAKSQGTVYDFSPGYSKTWDNEARDALDKLSTKYKR